MIRAAFDSIIVEPIIEEEQKFGNIIVPDTGKEKGILAKVISVGEGKYSVTGNFIKTTIQVNQKVLIPNMGPVRINYENKEYYGLAENMIIAIID